MNLLMLALIFLPTVDVIKLSIWPQKCLFLTLIVQKYSATLFIQGGGVPTGHSGHSGHKGTN